MPICKKCGKPVKSAVVMHSACAEAAFEEVMDVVCRYCKFTIAPLYEEVLEIICSNCEIEVKLWELFVKGGDPV